MKTNITQQNETILQTQESKAAMASETQPRLAMTASQDYSSSATRAVINNHLNYFGARNLDGVLSDYSPEAILFMPNAVLKGVDEIRKLFVEMIAEFEKPGAVFHMKQQNVEGDYGYILWTAETPDNVYELGTDTFIVRNGKIVAQSYTGKIAAKQVV